jgi:hypothetical protein
MHEIAAIGNRIELHRDDQMPDMILLPRPMMCARHALDLVHGPAVPAGLHHSHY